MGQILHKKLIVEVLKRRLNISLFNFIVCYKLHKSVCGSNAASLITSHAFISIF